MLSINYNNTIVALMDLLDTGNNGDSATPLIMMMPVMVMGTVSDSGGDNSDDL